MTIRIKGAAPPARDLIMCRKKGPVEMSFCAHCPEWTAPGQSIQESRNIARDGGEDSKTHNSSQTCHFFGMVVRLNQFGRYIDQDLGVEVGTSLDREMWAKQEALVEQQNEMIQQQIAALGDPVLLENEALKRDRVGAILPRPADKRRP